MRFSFDVKDADIRLVTLFHESKTISPGLTEHLAEHKLLENLKRVPDEKRTARFVCALCCYFSEDNYFFVRGECEGVIAHERFGNGGFGYDPLFIHDGKSFAEMSAEEKDECSHRGIAMRLLKEKLNDFLTIIRKLISLTVALYCHSFMV